MLHDLVAALKSESFAALLTRVGGSPNCWDVLSVNGMNVFLTLALVTCLWIW